MASRAERHSYYLICLIVALNQAPDLLPPFASDYYAVPYLMRFTIDITSLILIIAALEPHRIPAYVKMIISVQSISLLIHAIMLSMNVIIRYWPHEVVAMIHDQYQPSMEAAFYFKLCALIWGGYGIIRINSNAGSDHLPDSHVPGIGDGVQARKSD